jgi:hypothetical protein
MPRANGEGTEELPLEKPPRFQESSLDDHWAVKVLPTERAAGLLAYAMSTLRGMANGQRPPAEVPEDLETLASGYELAAREALGRDDPTVPPRKPGAGEDATARTRIIEEGVGRAFVLHASIPLDEHDPLAPLYHTLLLAALGEVAGRQHEFRLWLSLHRDQLFRADPSESLDVRLLRNSVELWTEVLSGSGPSGLDRAMELVATVREQLTMSGRDFIQSLAGEERVRMEFLLFAVSRLTEGATEVLLQRLHGEQPGSREAMFLCLAVVGPAAAGNRVLWIALLWLQEAAVRVITRRTPQLDLLPNEPTAH